MSDSNFDFGDGAGLVPAKRHINPDGSEGGWVAATASVAPTAFIGPEARVFGQALVSDKAVVFDKARVYDKALVFGQALVSGQARVSDKAQVSGQAQVYDQALVSGQAQVYGQALVSGQARVLSKDDILIISQLKSRTGYYDLILFKTESGHWFKWGCCNGPDLIEYLNETKPKYPKETEEFLISAWNMFKENARK